MIFNNAIMGSIPRHPIWSKVFQELDKRKSEKPPTKNSLDRSKINNVWHTTGPGLLNDCIIAEKYHEKSTVRVCSGYIFEPYLPRKINGKIVKSKDTTMSYSIHHVSSSWVPQHHRLVGIVADFCISIYLEFRLWVSKR